MRVLILTERDVRNGLSMTDCIEAMDGAFRAVAAGTFVQPLRIISWQPDRRGGVAAMPAYLEGMLGAKLITVFPENRKSGLESHQGLVALHEAQTGKLLAIAHAGAITAIRTAAVSALATRLLANEDAGDLALLGSGTQAEEHLRAVSAVRPVRRVRVWSRNFEHAREFAQRHAPALAVPIAPCQEAREAVSGADIICTVTAATEPVLQGAWVAPGTHINAVGSSVPPFRELDVEMVRRSRLFVDMRACALQEADDLRVPLREGAIREEDVAELSEMVTGTRALRGDRGEITLFKSVGMAVEDLAAARLIYERALEGGLGTAIDF